MRTALTIVVLTFFAALANAGDAPAQARRWTHVRPITSSARSLVAEATARSSIVTGLMDDLERSDVVVYVVDGMAGIRTDPPASLAFLSCAAGVRYVRVQIGRWMTPPWVRIAELAHELQHAVEVARAPEVKDGDSLGRLYRRIGWESQRGRFESQEAVTVGFRVLYQQLGTTR